MKQTRILDSAIFDEVAAVIGSGDAGKLCDRFGGTNLYVPKVPAANHEISILLGPDQAKLFCKHFAGETLPLPKAYHRKQRALQMIAEGRHTVAAIALATDYSERQVYNFIAESREDDGQLSLFDRLP